MLETLTAAGVSTDGLVVHDGSGLAETNALTCRAVADILVVAGADSDFAATMAIAGERGTLLGRMVDTAAEGAVFAKTGTLNDSTALSGYVRSANDADIDLVFAYIANARFIGADRPVLDLQDAFAERLTGYPGTPSVEDLSPFPAAIE